MSGNLVLLSCWKGSEGEQKVSTAKSWLISGMIHVSMLSGARVNNPSEIVKRNDRVKVKVMSIVGDKYGLSMKDVDQRTGVDQS